MTSLQSIRGVVEYVLHSFPLYLMSPPTIWMTSPADHWRRQLDDATRGVCLLGTVADRIRMWIVLKVVIHYANERCR